MIIISNSLDSQLCISKVNELSDHILFDYVVVLAFTVPKIHSHLLPHLTLLTGQNQFTALIILANIQNTPTIFIKHVQIPYLKQKPLNSSWGPG